MASSHDNISNSNSSRASQTCANEERRRQEELETLLTLWSDDDLVVEPEVSRRLYERERDCELTLSGSLDLVKQNPNVIWTHVADALQELHIARLKLKTYDADKIRETLNIWRGLVAYDQTRASSLALALTSFGRLYCSIGRYDDAEEVCLEATNLYREIFIANPEEGRESGFFTMICLAEAYFETGRYDDAERASRMASGFLKKITVDKARYAFVFNRIRHKLDERSQTFDAPETNRNLRDEARNYCRNASRLWRWGSLQEAEESYLKAIEIYCNPDAMENDVERRARLAETLDELGRLCCQPKFAKYAKAEEYFTESAAIQRELARLDPVYVDSFATVLLNLATYYERQKRWEELEQTLREALETLETNEREFNPMTPLARARLANLLRRSNRAEEAIDEYCRALELWDEARGDAAELCRADVATARFRLAELYKRAKRWDEAEQSYEVAQNLFRELSEKDDASYTHKLASSLNNLATLRSNSERGLRSDVDYMIAEKNYQEALALYRRLREEDSGSVDFEFATALYNSALLHEKLSDADKAEKEYLEALEIQRELAKEKPEEYGENVARTLTNLAALYRSNPFDPLRSEKAEPLYEEALRVYESLERERPQAYRRKIVRTLRNLANVHSEDPDRKELAEEEYRRAVTFLVDLTRRFPDVATYKSELADVYSRLGALRLESGSLNDARQCYLDAQVKYEELTRVNPRKYSVKLAETFDALSELYQKTGALAEMLRARESAVNAFEKAALEDPDADARKAKLATANYRLALACQKLGQDERAKDAYLVNLSILDDLAQEDPAPFRLDRARVYNNLAIVSQKLNQLEDAEVEYAAAVGLYRELESNEPGAYKHELAKTLNNLAALCQESGKLADAEKNFVDALAIRRELAEESPEEYKSALAVSLLNLSSFYFEQDRLYEAESCCRESIAIFEEYASDDEQRRNFERASTKLRGIRDEIEEREIQEAFVEQSDEYPSATTTNIRERVAYVYVSSAKDDMSAEREFLEREIFPRVRACCKSRGVEFVPLDLRREEIGDFDEARVLTLGLTEIERTRPFFIGLLGDVYGKITPFETLEKISELNFVPFAAQESFGSGVSALEAEFQFGVMREPYKVDALFCMRSGEAEPSCGENRREKPGTESFKKLTTLKKKLRAQKFHPTCEYRSLEEFGEQVERALLAWIDRSFGAKTDVWNFQIDAQGAFDERLRQNYAPNQADYDALDAFMQSDSPVLTLVGASGVGKSALLTNWSARVCRENPNLRVATYHIGVDGRADAPSDVLTRLTRALTSSESYSASASEKTTLKERASAFFNAVEALLQDSPETELLVVIDGLNRLTEAGGAKDLTWLTRLPKRAKYLLTTTADDATMGFVARQGWNVYELKSASLEARRASIREFATSEERLAQIIEAPFASNLHALRALLPVLSSGALTDEAFERFAACRSTGEFFDALFAQIERRFDEDDDSKTSRQDFMLASALLAASSCGLTFEELRRASGLSVLKLLEIHNALNCVLDVKGDRRRFANERVRQFVLKRYAERVIEARRRLLEICDSEDVFKYCFEVPYQYFQLEDWNALKESLFDFERFVALYDGTTACDFCKYWDAAQDVDDRKLDEFFKLEGASGEKSSFYWRALGDFASLYRDQQTAEEAWRRALENLRGSLEGFEGFYPPLVRLLDNLGDAYWSTRREQDAEVYYREALELYQEASKENPRGYKRRVAEITRRLAFIDVEAGRSGDAERELLEALQLESELEREESKDATNELAEILIALGNLHFADGRSDEAEVEYQDALRLRRRQAQESPEKFNREVAATLVALATLRRRVNRLSESDADFQIALDLYRDLTKNEPCEFKPNLAFVLKNLAELHVEFNRKSKADVEFNEAATLYRELNEETPGAFDSELVATLKRWAEFYRESSRLADAREKYAELVELCRKAPVESRGEDYFDALNNLADLLLLIEEKDDALEVYSELVQALCRQGVADRESTLRLVDALRKSASLRFDAGDYALVAEEYESLAAFSRVLASSNFEERAGELLRSYEILNAAYAK